MIRQYLYGTYTTLHAASGGDGNFSYHWSPEELLLDPDVQYPQTVILSNTAIFSLLVTNQATQCQSYDEVVVTITGGPLTVNPGVIPNHICNGDYAQLYSNAGGGSQDYSYTWTCEPPGSPPWTSNMANPVVWPDSSKHYLLSVFDGFTTVSGSTDLNVFQLPTATISGGDTLCGTGNFASLPVDLTGTPPWSFIYTNGITSVIVNNQYTSPYNIITGDPGTYTIVDLEDANCSGESYGSATVAVFPYPATPDITVIDMALISSVCCGNQWYLNNEAIPGATGQIYNATQSGWYFDIVTLNGCSSDTSEIVDITVGISEISEHNIKVAPNPAKDFVNVFLTEQFRGDLIIKIFSFDGREIRVLAPKVYAGEKQIPVNISDLNPGLYFITLNTNDLKSVCKLIVLK